MKGFAHGVVLFVGALCVIVAVAHLAITYSEMRRALATATECRQAPEPVTQAEQLYRKGDPRRLFHVEPFRPELKP